MFYVVPIFSTWWVNFVVYGTVIFLIIILRGSPKVKNVASTNIDVNYKSEYFRNIGDLQSKLVSEYFSLNENIEICTGFRISSQEILDILSSRRKFPFESACSCSVTQVEWNYYLKIHITFSQGCKIFMAIRNPEIINKLNVQDKQAYEKILLINSRIISPSMSSLEKEKTIHDYLISTSKYDHENYLKGTIPAESYTPYGLLFNHIGVCQAYAEIFMIFMLLTNIECYMVIGTTLLNGGNDIKDRTHAWNIVKINGKYFHVDVTFDNPTPYAIGAVGHKYFNVQDALMDKTHIWKVDEYPICS